MSIEDGVLKGWKKRVKQMFTHTPDAPDVFGSVCKPNETGFRLWRERTICSIVEHT